MSLKYTQLQFGCELEFYPNIMLEEEYNTPRKQEGRNSILIPKKIK